MYLNSPVHKVTTAVVNLMFYCGILCVAVLPFLSRRLERYFCYQEGQLIPIMVLLLLSGLCAEYILYQLKCMFRTLKQGNPFIGQTVARFRKMAVACAVIALLYVVKLLFLFTLATVLIAMIFAIGCLFCLTLKDLFKQALLYKEENELTI